MAPTPTHAHQHHRWHFFRAGGFDQVRLESGADIVHLEHLDRKLWVALACPTRGLEFDAKTLDLLDTDHDGRIRAPEILAAAKWVTALLKNPDDLLHSAPALPLAAINDATPEGRTLLASARQILVDLGKPEALHIDLDDVADTAKIFANTKFNGDGIIPADSAADPLLQAVIADIIACLGSEMDRSGKPGITQEKLDAFFAAAQAYADWSAQPTLAPMPLGIGAAAGAAAVKAVASKVEDYFIRCHLAAFDPRSTAAINRTEADYLALAPKDLSATAPDIAALPLAQIGAHQPLPLTGTPTSGSGINPAWRAAIDTLNTQVIKPLLGDKASLTEAEWTNLLAQFAPVDAWLAAKSGATVEKLGLARIREILALHDGKAQPEIADLIGRDKALESEASSIAAVERLIRYHRDFYKLLNNFVSFRDFYARKDKAVFQVGTLYLDQRACDLCVRVDDPPKHALMAHLSRSYLAYCDLTRKAADGTIERMTIAAAFTAGDSDNLMVGRNGIFLDRHGHDWDATITKLVENPISIRQGFFSPYKRAMRMISNQVAKRAAAAETAATEKIHTAAANAAVAAATGTAPPPPPAAVAKPKIDVGTLAAIGLVLSSVLGVLTGLLVGFMNLGIYMPLGILVLVLLISGPSMFIAWFKLRQRNIGPILDANGWAVNAKAKLNIPFGRSLTHTPKFPPGSQRNLTDPYAEKHITRNIVTIVVVVLALLAGIWYVGFFQSHYPSWMPRSSRPLSRQTTRLLRQGRENLAQKDPKDLAPAADAVAQLQGLKPKLVTAGIEKEFEGPIATLEKDLAAAQAKATVPPVTRPTTLPE